MERAYDETLIARLAAAEKQVQQSYRPVIGVHKWFARRPGALFRGLALAALDGRPLAEHYFDGHDVRGVVLDPFMGGGTALFEANRLGLSVAGHDTNPMARWVVERELEPLDVDAFAAEGEAVCADVEAVVGDLYLTRCAECGDDAPVKSFLWVKTARCAAGHETARFPGPLVAGRRMGRHTHDVLVCAACRAVEQHAVRPEACPRCGAAYGAAGSRCACGAPFAPADGPPAHALFALEYHCAACRPGRRGRFFKGADADDHARFAAARERLAESPYWPEDPIPPGDETRRLLRWGYRRWRELHNERQLLGLAALAERIRAAPAPLRPALATVYSDCIRYQNMICRYDTAALKVLDVFSVHGFPVHRVQCEAALIGLPRVGSGGFRHFLAKYAAAKRYCAAPFETDGRRRVAVPGERIAARFVDDPAALAEPRTARLRHGSLAADALPAGSVDAVLTDPPYFANVQYAELMDLLYAWLRRLVPETPYFAAPTTRSPDEATGNVTGGVGLEEYTARLSDVYRAAARALKPGRPFAFTFHHNDLRAYAAPVVAALDAGLVPVTAFACPTEMRGSVHIHGAASSRVDTVFVLRKPPAPLGDVSLERQARSLARAGVTVSDADRRCLRHGVLALAAMRALAPGWDATAPVAERLGRAREGLSPAADAPTSSCSRRRWTR